MNDARTKQLITDLEAWFRDLGSCVVALSGGIDSSLVAFLARRFLGRESCLAVVGESASLKRRDLKAAVRFAEMHDIPLEIVETCEMEDPAYVANPENRCYHCKSELFTRLEEVRRRVGFAAILGGENKDDHADYRPGLQAASEHRVRGPLAECGVTKDEVRSIALHFHLECWEKPASPCLSSRIPYFEEITADKLRQIEAGETLLESQGFPESRVRHYGSYARLEVPRQFVRILQEQEAEIGARFRELGFARIEIDPEGYVTGKMNRALG